METLKQSLRQRGQQAPIVVDGLGHGAIRSYIQAVLSNCEALMTKSKVDSIKTESDGQAALRDVKVCTNPDGSPTLYGSSVDAEFRGRLMRWLRGENG